MIDLLKKLNQLDETVVSQQTDTSQPQTAHNVQGGAGAADEGVEECGDMGVPTMGTEVEECPQDGNVQLSMQDLIKLVHALQHGEQPHAGHSDMALFGDEEEGVEEEFANAQAGASEPEVAPIAAVTPTGDDMFSKGGEAIKVNGGGNPLQAHLAELYAQVKARPLPEAKSKKAKKDYDGDGKIESEKDEVWGSRMKAAKKAGSLKEANEVARKLRKL